MFLKSVLFANMSSQPRKTSMSLYRKYRPKNFDSLVGQDHIRTTLINALKLGRVNHAYLFTGPRGTGKTSAARIMAKAINCVNLKDATPCEECEICRDIGEGRLIDVIEIDAASNGRVEEIRDLREKINFAPTRAKNKVYIIDEVHMISRDGFNALLKTLEEPPERVFFIMATTEVHKIPETILSRCQRFDFKRIDDRVIVDRLQFIATEEKVEADSQALEAIAHTAQGGLRDAIGLMEQLITGNKLEFAHVCDILGLSGFASIEKLYGHLQQKDSKPALEEIHNLYVEGYDLTRFNKGFLEFLRKKLLQSVEDRKTGETAWLLKLVALFRDSYDAARYATIPQLPLEMAVIEACVEGATFQTATLETAVPAEREHREIKPAQASMAPSKPQPEPVRQVSPIKSPVIPTSTETASNAAPIPKTTPAPVVELTMDTIKAVWPRILERIHNPTVKRSFRESALGDVHGSDVTLAFSTKFHLDKTMETTNRVELEDAFAQVLNAHVKIKGELKKVTASINKEEEALAEKAAAIFEGEVV
jgi:DNA polymerase III subunit gamma/tau